jgi:hypothetical protein
VRRRKSSHDYNQLTAATTGSSSSSTAVLSPSSAALNAALTAATAASITTANTSSPTVNGASLSRGESPLLTSVLASAARKPSTELVLGAANSSGSGSSSAMLPRLSLASWDSAADDSGSASVQSSCSVPLSTVAWQYEPVLLPEVTLLFFAASSYTAVYINDSLSAVRVVRDSVHADTCRVVDLCFSSCRCYLCFYSRISCTAFLFTFKVLAAELAC